MTNRRYAEMMLKFGLLASVLTASFWGIWSMFATVPDHSVLRLTPVTSWTIPLSRWFDVVFAFFAVQIYAWPIRGYLLLSKKFSVSRDDLAFSLGFSVIFSLGVGLVYCLGFGLVAGLVAGLFACLIYGLVACLIYGLVVVLKYLFSLKIWSLVGRWFLTRDAN